MDQSSDIAGSIDRERVNVAECPLHGSDPLLLMVRDNLDKMPVSDEEIAAVEAFLGLQAATILGENKSNRSKAI